MKAVLLAIGLIALPAQAQLYRWIDPDSGSVKFSSYPPPWYRDAESQERGPAVELIVPRQQAAKPEAAKPAPDKPAPAKPAARSEPAPQ